MAWYDNLLSVFLIPKVMSTQSTKVVEPWRQLTIDEAFKIVMAVANSMGLTTLQGLLIFCQAGLESAWFRGQRQIDGGDSVFKKNWNAFGMKMPAKRQSPYILAKGTAAPSKESYAGDPYNYYAKYASFADSVKDVIHLYNYNGIRWNVDGATANAFVNFIASKRYFQGPEKDYRSNMAYNVKKYGTKLSAAGVAGLGGAMLGVIALLFFLTLK